MLHILSTALADGGPLCHGILALGLVLGVVHGATSGMAVRRSRRGWLALWPFATLTVVAWACTVHIQGDVASALQDYTRATWPMRLQAGLNSLAGVAVATGLAMLTVAGAGGSVASVAAWLRGGHHTAWHAMVPVVLIGGFAASIPEHTPLVVTASLAALWGLLATSRNTDAPTRALTGLNTAVMLSAGCSLTMGLHTTARIQALPTQPEAALVGVVGVVLAMVGMGVPWVAMRPGRAGISAVLAVGCGIGLVFGAVALPLRAAHHLHPERDHIAQRDHLGRLMQRGVDPAVVSTAQALSQRAVITVTRDLLLVGDEVVAYRNETSRAELTRALASHRHPLAIDAHEVWTEVAPILMAVDSAEVDVVVRCPHAVLCTVPVELSDSGMAVPNEMRWAEVVERSGGQAGLILRPTSEP